MRLKQQYKQEVIPKLKEQFGHTNTHEIPTFQKVTVNIGLGKGVQDAKYLETAERTLRRITGQKPIKTLARKSISNFKIREGNVVGMVVTLRGAKMWDFLEKLIRVSLPRTRDFRGLSPTSFDGQGNYSIGFREHIAFPEIRSDEVEAIHGVQVTIGMNARRREEAHALLKTIGFPLKET